MTAVLKCRKNEKYRKDFGIFLNGKYSYFLTTNPNGWDFKRHRKRKIQKRLRENIFEIVFVHILSMNDILNIIKIFFINIKNKNK